MWAARRYRDGTALARGFLEQIQRRFFAPFGAGEETDVDVAAQRKGVLAVEVVREIIAERERQRLRSVEDGIQVAVSAGMHVVKRLQVIEIVEDELHRYRLADASLVGTQKHPLAILDRQDRAAVRAFRGAAMGRVDA